MLNPRDEVFSLSKRSEISSLPKETVAKHQIDGRRGLLKGLTSTEVLTKTLVGDGVADVESPAAGVHSELHVDLHHAARAVVQGQLDDPAQVALVSDAGGAEGLLDPLHASLIGHHTCDVTCLQVY